MVQCSCGAGARMVYCFCQSYWCVFVMNNLEKMRQREGGLARVPLLGCTFGHYLAEKSKQQVQPIEVSTVMLLFVVALFHL